MFNSQTPSMYQVYSDNLNFSSAAFAFTSFLLDERVKNSLSLFFVRRLQCVRSKKFGHFSLCGLAGPWLPTREERGKAAQERKCLGPWCVVCARGNKSVCGNERRKAVGLERTASSSRSSSQLPARRFPVLTSRITMALTFYSPRRRSPCKVLLTTTKLLYVQQCLFHFGFVCLLHWAFPMRERARFKQPVLVGTRVHLALLSAKLCSRLSLRLDFRLGLKYFERWPVRRLSENFSFPIKLIREVLL